MALCETETKVTWKMTSYELKSVKVGAYYHPMVRVYWKPHETFKECYEKVGLTLEKIVDPAILAKEPNVSYKPCKCVYFKFMDQPDWIVSSSEMFRMLKEDQKNEELFMKTAIRNSQVTGIPQW